MDTRPFPKPALVWALPFKSDHADIIAYVPLSFCIVVPGDRDFNSAPHTAHVAPNKAALALSSPMIPFPFPFAGLMTPRLALYIPTEAVSLQCLYELRSTDALDAIDDILRERGQRKNCIRTTRSLRSQWAGCLAMSRKLCAGCDSRRRRLGCRMRRGIQSGAGLHA